MKKIKAVRPTRIRPAVSVIVPVYNTAKYVAETLDSILAQTFQDYEIICINDGSTDDSLSILEKYAARDKRIKIIDQKNQGICHARNNAIAAARGKYIYPLDSDDKIAPTCLQELHRTITTTDAALICTDGVLFGVKTGDWVLPEPTRWNMYTGKNAIHNSSMYEKKYWEKFGGYYKGLNNLVLEDFDFWLNFVDAGLKFTRIQKPLFFYRIKNGDESRNSKCHSDADIFKRARRIIRRRHPKMRLYRLVGRLPRFFWRNVAKDNGIHIIKIFKIPVWRYRHQQ
jgi:glycosyltransferase involved in cell wall biosynthesis